MAENAEDTGISSAELIRRMERQIAILEKNNTELMQMQRERHQNNNTQSVAYVKALNVTADANERLAGMVAAREDDSRTLVQLKHWAFGPAGNNGVHSKLEKHEKRMDKQEEISARHSTLISKGMGGLGLLNIIIGIALAIWLRG